MKLLIILLCLSLERYLNLGAFLYRYSWFPAYRGLLDKIYKYRPQGRFADWLQYGFIVLPLLLVFCLVYWILVLSLHKVGAFFVSLFVLLYSLGPVDLYHQLQKHQSAKEGDQNERLTNLGAEAGVQQNRELTIAVFLAANTRLFAVILWYLLLGPIGAILYRVSTLLANDKQEAAEVVTKVLDWVPARLEALFYSLVGHFADVFGCLLRHLIGGLDSSKDLIEESGLLALDANEDANAAPADEYAQALALIDRATIVGLALIAVFTLGMWLA